MGNLYVVATPIGNLEDITLRAMRILSEVDLILCENTLHSLKLLNHIGVKNKLYNYNSYNKERVTTKILEKLNKDLNIALITDSGTPCISDPGSALISSAQKEGHSIIPIPGACAAIALLSASGLTLHNFIFAGFLSPKSGKRTSKLKLLKAFKGNIIIYESPKRIQKLLNEIATIFAEEEIVIGRELTKKFEEITKGKANEIIKVNAKEKGEYTLIISNTKSIK